MITQINAALGTNFVVAGNYPDLADATFTFPAKADFVDIIISGKYSADGVPPTSIRIKPGTTLTLTLANSGYKLTDVVVARTIHPLKKADANLNWALTEVNPVDGIKQHPALILRNVDFSDLFAKPAAEIMIFVTEISLGYDGSRYQYQYYYDFTQTMFDAINTRLTQAGLSTLSTKRFQIAGDQNRPTLEQAKSRLSTVSSTLGANPAVNGTYFNRVVKIPVANITAKAGVLAADYYLHFNM